MGKLSYLSALVLSILVAGCGSENAQEIIGKPKAYEFQITVTNLTAGQPLSPAALILHDPGWHLFSTGVTASEGLEYIAEAGDNQPLMRLLRHNVRVRKTDIGAAPILPGGSESFVIRVRDRGQLFLSYAAMLVNTNDGFAGLDALKLSDMAKGAHIEHQLMSYDSGTEANSETANTVPGPAVAGGLGQGFNPARDDVRDQVYVHPGVVSVDDGLDTSALSSLQRWDNPVARIEITRLD